MLYDKYRPKSPKEFVGSYQQKVATELLKEDFNPFNVLLMGPSGTGKTSLGLLYAEKLESANVKYENCRNVGGVGGLREILNANFNRTLFGNGRTILFLDELHALSKEAQQALLDIEDTENRYLYIIAATDQPTKIVPALRSRFADYNLPIPTMVEIKNHMVHVLRSEGFDLEKATEEDKKLLNFVFTDANGNLRTLLNRLEQFLNGTLQITKEVDEAENNLFSLVMKKETIGEVAKAAKEEANLYGLTIGLTNYGYKLIESGNKRGLALMRVFGKGLNPDYPPNVAFVLLYDEYLKNS